MSLSNAATLEGRARQSLGSSHDAIYRLVDRALADRDIAGGRLVDGCGSAGLWRLLAPPFAAYCGLDAVRYEGFPIDAEFCEIDRSSSAAFRRFRTRTIPLIARRCWRSICDPRRGSAVWSQWRCSTATPAAYRSRRGTYPGALERRFPRALSDNLLLIGKKPAA